MRVRIVYHLIHIIMTFAVLGLIGGFIFVHSGLRGWSAVAGLASLAVHFVLCMFWCEYDKLTLS